MCLFSGHDQWHSGPEFTGFPRQELVCVCVCVGSFQSARDCTITHTRNWIPLHQPFCYPTNQEPPVLQLRSSVFLSKLHYIIELPVMDEALLAINFWKQKIFRPPFVWRCELLTRPLVLRFTTLCHCINSRHCVCVRARTSVSGRDRIWKCLFPLSQQGVEQPSLPTPVFYFCILS